MLQCSSCRVELAQAGLGDPLLKALAAQAKLLSGRDEDMLLELLTCATDIARFDTKFAVGVRLGGGAVLALLISLLRWTNTSSGKSLLVVLRCLLELGKSPATAALLYRKGCVKPLMAILANDNIKTMDVLVVCALVLQAVLQVPETSQSLLQKGILRSVYDLLLLWSKGDARYAGSRRETP